MKSRRRWFSHPVFRSLQHLVFWVLSYWVFVQLFRSGAHAEKIDYLYAGLFHLTVVPAVYINVGWLLPRLANFRWWGLYVPVVLLVIVLFTWLNYSFFQDWSRYLLPDYFFISYFTVWEVSLFFVVYLVITSLLKLSKSWFTVNDMQRKLLQLETERAQMELSALKDQVNPHFFLNTLNGIYSMTLSKDERLPETILQLSQLMKYFLYESREHFVLLEREWQILNEFIALQRLRSNDQLSVQLSLQGEIEQQKIAPLLLVTFVENAFKHGAKGNTGAAKIEVMLEILPQRIRFEVRNTSGQATVVGEAGHKGVGLENVKRRLALLYADRYVLNIDETATDFIVKLELKV